MNSLSPEFQHLQKIDCKSAGVTAIFLLALINQRAAPRTNKREQQTLLFTRKAKALGVISMFCCVHVSAPRSSKGSHHRG